MHYLLSKFGNFFRVFRNSGAPSAKRASGAPWWSKSTHPRKFGNHVTVHRPSLRATGKPMFNFTLSSSFGSIGKLILHTYCTSMLWSIDLFTETAAILNLLGLRSIMGCPGGTRLVFKRAFRTKRELQCIFLWKKAIVITSKHGTTIFFSSLLSFSRKT